MLGTILSYTSEGAITLSSFLICLIVSLAAGFVIALSYMYKNSYNKSFVVMLTLLPAIVQVVITVVNGNLGAGVAVAGAFGLVRFRSAQGGGREIGTIFLSMAVGLATGMGYIGIAILLTLVICLLTFLLMTSRYADEGKTMKDLKVTIPENLEYEGVFDDLFTEYTSKCSLEKVKTAQMGAVYELHYQIVMKDPSQTKKLLDEIRCRNGNLPVSLGKIDTVREEL